MICITKSAAYLLGIEPEKLENEVGYTGEEVVSYGRRSIHVQELLPSFLSRGYSLTFIQPTYAMGTPDSTIKVTEENFDDYLSSYNGLVMGLTPGGKAHCVAKKNGAYYDPKTDSIISKLPLSEIHLFSIVLPIR